MGISTPLGNSSTRSQRMVVSVGITICALPVSVFGKRFREGMAMTTLKTMAEGLAFAFMLAAFSALVVVL